MIKQLFCFHDWENIINEDGGVEERLFDVISDIEVDRFKITLITKKCKKCGKIKIFRAGTAVKNVNNEKKAQGGFEY